MIIMADPYATLERKIGRRVRDDETHRRISEALTEVAVAAIHPARHLGLGRSSAHGMLEDSIENATQAAIETLIVCLEDLVESLPRPVIDKLAMEQLATEFGIE
jgi:hypothetical protein